MATLAFTACQNENLDIDFNTDPSAVRVNATVGEGINITRSNPAGDATTQKVFNAGDKISVSADEQSAVIYTFTNGTWNPEANKYLKWNTPSMTFTAYYPATAGTDAQSFTLPTDQSDLAKIAAADYMTFSGDKAKTEANTVDIAMQRKTARVIVHIAGFNDQYATGYSVSAASVSGNTSGYNTGGTTTGPVTVSACKATDTDFYALLTPTTADGGATFITLTVTDGTTPTPLTVKGIPALEAGKSYTYNVTVGKNRITIGSVTVKDWGSEVVIPEGEAIELPFQDPKFVEVLINNHSVPHTGNKIDFKNAETLVALKKITNLNVGSKGITSLKGIEYMTGLTKLDCDRNQLTALDLSKNTALTILYCSNNQLTALDVKANTALTDLVCTVNQLTALDVKANTELTILNCEGNQLTALNVTMNTKLKSLQCGLNSLTAIDVSKNTALTVLNCRSSSIDVIDVSKNTALTVLDCSGNQLTTLDVQVNTALTDLLCYQNQLTALDVSANTALETMWCGAQKEELQLTLTLTAAQLEMWEKDKDQSSNSSVELNVVN
ncbi:fimbrillin family protein [Bacteroides sp.]|uniref:fimbrillin family protein n=1 Tax=Bacteroides sp. TaxID=29523 RepID=UPI00261CB66A|nr:fimbrillin family protein [Bacteroides sp.]MDD3036935.1 fimbrillin family protein [Bacteroides sp.]